MGGLRYPGAAANSLVGGFFEGRAEKRAQERHDQDSEIRAGQIEDIKRSREYQAMNKDINSALGEFITTGGANTIPLRDAYNTHNPGSNKSLVDAIEPLEDGGYDMRFADGRAVKFKDMDDLGMKFTAMTDPAVYLTAMQKSKDIKQDVGKQLELHEGKIKLDRKYGIPAGGRNASATVETLNWIKENMGVDGPQAMEIFKHTNENPQAMAANIYQKMMSDRDKNFLPGDAGRPSDEDLQKRTVDLVKSIQTMNFGGVSTRYNPQKKEGVPDAMMRPRSPLTALDGQETGPIGPSMGLPPRLGAPPAEQTATHPKTGERLVLRNGKWQPL